MKANNYYFLFFILSLKLFSMEKIPIKDMNFEQFQQYFEHHFNPGSPRFKDALKRQRENLGLQTGNDIQVAVAKPASQKIPVEIKPNPVKETSHKKVHFSLDTKGDPVEEISTPRYFEPPVPTSIESDDSDSSLDIKEEIEPTNFSKNKIVTQAYSDLPDVPREVMSEMKSVAIDKTVSHSAPLPKPSTHKEVKINDKNGSFFNYLKNNKTTFIIGTLLLLECADIGWTYKKIASTGEWKAADWKKRLLLLAKNSQQAQLVNAVRLKCA